MAVSTVEMAMLVLAIGNVILGLVIGYQAYRGFRRHKSGPMRTLSIGLILLTAIAYTFAFLAWLGVRTGVIPDAFGDPLWLIYRLLQFSGLAFITYSLYKRP